MATIGTLYNLSDRLKHLDPDGTEATVAEVLVASHPILDDMPTMPGNLPTGHRSVVRTGLSTTSLRRLNLGIPSSKGTVTQIQDTISIFESQSRIDEEVLEGIGGGSDGLAFRRSEWPAFVESMSQDMIRVLFDGNTASDNAEFMGFYLRTAYAAVGDQAIDAGSNDTDNTSVWLVGKGPMGAMLVYPKHSKTAGVQHIDRGIRLIHDDADETDVAGTAAFYWVDVFKARLGLTIKDERNVVRIGSIDISDLQGVTGDHALTGVYSSHLKYAMVKSLHRIPNREAVNLTFYMGRSTFEALDVQYTAQSNVNAFTAGQQDGKEVTMFRGVPVKIVDHLGYAETAI